MYNRHTHGDFKKYYDTRLKRNYWVLGYFGGGSVNLTEAMELANDYAKETGAPLEKVCIDEVLRSRRFKGFKFLFVDTEQHPEKDSDVCDDVYGWLTD